MSIQNGLENDLVTKDFYLFFVSWWNAAEHSGNRVMMHPQGHATENPREGRTIQPVKHSRSMCLELRDSSTSFDFFIFYPFQVSKFIEILFGNRET